MKKLFFAVLCALLLVSCDVPYTPNSENGARKEYHVNDICDLMPLCSKDGYRVFVDKRTGVLYIAYSVGHKFGITPIMKPDGSCLTLSEWKEEDSQ